MPSFKVFTISLVENQLQHHALGGVLIVLIEWSKPLRIIQRTSKILKSNKALSHTLHSPLL